MTRSVLITGCSTGIGQALALALHQRGLSVLATARRPDSLAALAAQGIRTAALDVDSEASIATLMAELARDDLAVDMLINNAGYGAMGPLAEMPADVLEQQFRTNVFGLMAITRAVIPGMVARGQGRIVNLGSVSGILTTPFAGAYCASKAAVHALSDALRLELAPFGIEVIVIQPGGIQSSFGANASAGVSARGDTLSLYAPVADAIAARANASQDNATPVTVFAEAMADVILAENPPAFATLGHGSTVLPALQRWLPVCWRDRLLGRRFGLARLGTK